MFVLAFSKCRSASHAGKRNSDPKEAPKATTKSSPKKGGSDDLWAEVEAELKKTLVEWRASGILRVHPEVIGRDAVGERWGGRLPDPKIQGKSQD